jgi:hypothetical protein
VTDQLSPSVRATYDSRKTGPRYWVTTSIDGKPVEFQRPLDDPFVRKTVNIEWRPIAWLPWPRLRVSVEVTVGGDVEVMNDVLELDENTLIAGRTRKAAFQQSMYQKLLAADRSAVLDDDID